MNTSMKLSDLIATPTSKPVKKLKKNTVQTEAHEPREIVSENGIITVKTEQGQQVGAFADILREAGYDPAYYALDTIQGVRTSQWDAQRKEWNEETEQFETKTIQLKSHKFRVIERDIPVDIDELAKLITDKEPAAEYSAGMEGTFLLTLGDTQFGKAFLAEDGTQIVLDNIEHVVSRAIAEAKHLKPNLVVIAWLGDCIEGIVSQNGKNAIHNTLTLTEQLRLVRRVQLKIIDRFIDAGFPEIDFLSVGGNHDETTRAFNVRYDDSYAVESALAVADAMELNTERYGCVKTYVPRKNEDYIAREYSGINVGFMHGHQFRPNKHFDWWAQQTFGDTVMGNTTVLFTGHLHHAHSQTRAGKLYVGVPALEPDSNWFIRLTGSTGDPGAQVTYLHDGRVERSFTIFAPKYDHYNQP